MQAKYPGTGGFTSDFWGPPRPGPGYAGEDLIAAVHRLNRVAAYSGIAARLQAVAVLEGVAAGICAAVQVFASELRHSGCGPEITDWIYGAAESFQSASDQCAGARAAMKSLPDAGAGGLAASGDGMPHESGTDEGR